MFFILDKEKNVQNEKPTRKFPEKHEKPHSKHNAVNSKIMIL
jgi:hypothetical protein